MNMITILVGKSFRRARSSFEAWAHVRWNEATRLKWVKKSLAPRHQGHKFCVDCATFFSKKVPAAADFFGSGTAFSVQLACLNIAWLLQTLSPTWKLIPYLAGKFQEAASTCWTSQSCSGSHISLISTWRSFWHVLYGCRLPRWFSSLVVTMLHKNHMDDGTQLRIFNVSQGFFIQNGSRISNNNRAITSISIFFSSDPGACHWSGTRRYQLLHYQGPRKTWTVAGWWFCVPAKTNGGHLYLCSCSIPSWKVSLCLCFSQGDNWYCIFFRYKPKQAQCRQL